MKKHHGPFDGKDAMVFFDFRTAAGPGRTQGEMKRFPERKQTRNKSVLEVNEKVLYNILRPARRRFPLFF